MLWEDTLTNQEEVETGHSKGIELPLVFNSLDSLFSLKNCDIIPILLETIGRACTNVVHTQRASSRFMPGFLIQQF